VLIALLVVLGVDLVVVFGLVVLVVWHNRWLRKQPGEFTGAIRVSSGQVSGLRSKWMRGSGRWVRDVLVWNSVEALNDLYARLRRDPAQATAIGEAGLRRVLAEHTYGQRLDTLAAQL